MTVPLYKTDPYLSQLNWPMRLEKIETGFMDKYGLLGAYYNGTFNGGDAIHNTCRYVYFLSWLGFSDKAHEVLTKALSSCTTINGEFIRHPEPGPDDLDVKWNDPSDFSRDAAISMYLGCRSLKFSWHTQQIQRNFERNNNTFPNGQWAFPQHKDMLYNRWSTTGKLSLLAQALIMVPRRRLRPDHVADDLNVSMLILEAKYGSPGCLTKKTADIYWSTDPVAAWEKYHKPHDTVSPPLHLIAGPVLKRFLGPKIY